MGRKGGWFSSVKKVFHGSDSRKQQKQKHLHRSKLGCFGYHEEPEEATIAVHPSLPPRKDVKPIEAENEQNKKALSLVLATAVAAAAAEVARLKNVSRYPGKTKEEIAAIKIQTVFRGYLARKSLRAMRGLARLKTLLQSQSVKRQAATTLQCMQTFSRLQSQVRARRIRMSEENQALQRQQQQKRENELEKLQAAQFGEKWDDSLQSKEQIEAKLLHKQVAAMRREKALAYALSHQQTWRNSSKSANATFMDPNNPHWGWNWLERWMASRPWEGQSTIQQNDHASTKSASSHTMSVNEITKLNSLCDQNHDTSKNPSPASRLRSYNNPPSNSKAKAKASSSPKGSSSGICDQNHDTSKNPSPASHLRSYNNPPSNSKAKAKASSSPKGSSSGGGGGDSRSMLSIKIESNRRHSFAVSQVRDDESLASSPAFATHTPMTPSIKGAKARSKVPISPSGAHSNNGTPEKGSVVLAKKRLSLSASPAGSRRHSVPTKVGIVVSNKSVANATIPEEKEKVKVRNGGSG